MNSSDAESWEIDIVGGGTFRSSNGDEINVGARWQWIVTADNNIRFLLYLDGIPTPIVRIVGPSARFAISRSTVAALRDVANELGVRASVV